MKRVKIKITGKVQGIFFRVHVKSFAIRNNITGYAKNINDNALEVLAEGEDNAILNIIEYCKKGPEGAIVEKLDIEEQSYKNEFKGFSIY
jgi:acylphosphatase